METLLFEKKESIALITINRPKEMNALNSQVMEEMDALIDQISKDRDIHVLIITGRGKAFIAGADIAEMKDKNSFEAKSFAKKGMTLFRKIENMDKVTISAVNGFALGGGCEFAMCTDIRIASEAAKFGQPEVSLGITPGFGGSQRLPRLVGEGRAKEIIFTGNLIDADEAYRIGLVNKVVGPDDLMTAAREMAENIASKAQIAVRNSKSAINRGMQTDIDTAMSIEEDAFALCFATEDQKEGMQAFLDKRKAQFKTK